MDDKQVWAVVELMGHVKHAGILTEEERFGVKMGRVDVPTPGGGFVTHLFGGASVYRITFVSEEAARAVAAHNESRPVQSWEMPKANVKALPAKPVEEIDTYDAQDGDEPDDHEPY